MIGSFALALLARLAQDESTWRTIETPYYRIHHEAAVEEDARAADACLREVVERLVEAFPGCGARALLDAAECDVWIHAQPTEQASDATTTLQTSVRDGVYVAELHVLALSRHSRDSRTVCGEPKDARYFARLLAHEYGTILLERIARAKPRGFGFFQAPTWFVQGYEEYLGITMTSEGADDATLACYRELLRADPTRISFDFGIEARDPYVDGCLLLAFLHEEFGAAKVQAILRSSEASWGAAMRAELGLDLAGLAARFGSWRDRRLTSEAPR